MKVRNIAATPRLIPALGRVVDVDEVFDVPDEFVTNADEQFPASIYEVIDRPVIDVPDVTDEES